MVCDGCGTVLLPHSTGTKHEQVIHGDRVNDSAGGDIADGPFDWCLLCARAAFAAVRAERGPA
jgi:hypothetical protein